MTSPFATRFAHSAPLVPPDVWEYLCLDRVPYHGRTLTLPGDKTGGK